MHTRHLAGGAVGLALALVPAAAAQNNAPGKPKGASAITVDAKPAIVVYSGTTSLSGRVSGRRAGGATIRLEADDTRPYGDRYRLSAITTTSDANGKYSFVLKPLQNTQYRTIAVTSPPATSAPKLVLVRPLVGLKLSDRTPARGALVRFSGSVYPAHDGRAALVQRRSTTGRFITVARTRLRDAGDARSAYSRRVRVRRDGVYRVKVPGDGDHINGFSRARTIDVTG